MDSKSFDVFISHSSKDQHAASAIKQHLQAAGIRCWKAPDDIMPGESWPQAISRALEDCRAMVLVWTSNSTRSAEVNKELTLAMSNSVTVVPFRIEEVEAPGEWKYHLANTHWMDAFSGELGEHLDGLTRLVQRILPDRDPVPPRISSAARSSAAPPVLPTTAPRPSRRASPIPWVLLVLGLVAAWLGLQNRRLPLPFTGLPPSSQQQTNPAGPNAMPRDSSSDSRVAQSSQPQSGSAATRRERNEEPPGNSYAEAPAASAAPPVAAPQLAPAGEPAPAPAPTPQRAQVEYAPAILPGEQVRTFHIQSVVDTGTVLYFFYDRPNGLSMDLNAGSATPETMAQARDYLGRADSRGLPITVYYLTKVSRNTGQPYELLTKIFSPALGTLWVNRKYAIP